LQKYLHMKTFTVKLAFLSFFILFNIRTSASPEGWVIGWGNNVSGEATGVPSSGYAQGVVTINEVNLTNAVAVAAGYGHGLALRNDGTVVGWGNNAGGEATGFASTVSPYRTNGVVSIDGHILRDIVAVEASRNQSDALTRNGKLITFGTTPDNSKVLVNGSLNGLVSIASRTGLAVKSDGTVITIRDGKTCNGISNIVAISTRSGSQPANFGLTKSGTVITWGTETTYGDATPPASATNVVAIAAGGGHTLALRSDRKIVGWGFNGAGEATGIPSTGSIYVTNDFVSIDGQVITNAVAIAAGQFYSLALLNNGTVVTWGSNSRHALDVPVGLKDVIAIAAGDGFCLAITTNAAVAEKFRQHTAMK
jgi:alpha-tubulin suppressor-like RCC1 family protein